jgi:hypothetical protein
LKWEEYLHNSIDQKTPLFIPKLVPIDREEQKAINPQRSDLNNKTKDYRRKGNTTETEELRKQKVQIPSRV